MDAPIKMPEKNKKIKEGEKKLMNFMEKEAFKMQFIFFRNVPRE